MIYLIKHRGADRTLKRYQTSESLPVGLLLAFSGGLLDAYSYLNRGQVFATAETGNIVLLGIQVAQGQWKMVIHYLLPIMAFALGILTTEQLRRNLRQHSGPIHWRQPLLLIECCIIAVVAFLPSKSMDNLANILISFTSAVQVESFRKINGCACITTMCTGNLRSGSENLFRVLARHEVESAEKARVYFSLILCFIAGAVVSGLLTPLLHEKTILVTILPLGAACILMKWNRES